jgi:hypothetical protein
LLGETFVETDFYGKQLARFDATARLSPPAGPQEMLRDTQAFKLAKNAVFLRIFVHDQTTNRIGSLTIPLASRSK